jgi:hypothetical protein
VGSEIEFHPAFGNRDPKTYARAKRSYARAVARLVYDPHLLYRHIVPSAFSTWMGPCLMSGAVTASNALWLIRRGFRYVPVSYTGIAFLNCVPFFARGLLARSDHWARTARYQQV